MIWVWELRVAQYQYGIFKLYHLNLTRVLLRNDDFANLFTRHLRVYMWCAKASQGLRLWHLRLKLVWMVIFGSYPAWESLETDILEQMMIEPAKEKWLSSSRSKKKKKMDFIYTYIYLLFCPTPLSLLVSNPWKSAELAFLTNILVVSTFF